MQRSDDQVLAVLAFLIGIINCNDTDVQKGGTAQKALRIEIGLIT